MFLQQFILWILEILFIFAIFFKYFLSLDIISVLSYIYPYAYCPRLSFDYTT